MLCGVTLDLDVSRSASQPGDLSADGNKFAN